MGVVVGEANRSFLDNNPEQKELLKPFLSCFDVTFAACKNVNNTVLYAYMIKPEKFMREGFGIEKEVLLVYSPHEELQVKDIQGAYFLLRQFPFRNRVDSLNCFIVSKSESIRQYRGLTEVTRGGSISVVPFTVTELQNNSDSWYIRNVLRENFFDVDLFGYMLPLRDESSFFGRQQIVARYIDSIKRCENRGVFGLRKTGKTSLLFKIDRIIREQKIGFVFYYDCKSPSYRKLHWNEFLGEICSNIAKRLKISIKQEYDQKNIIKSFRYVMKMASDRNKKIVIMFDEIEYISFKSPLDPHWQSEFVDFWQTIWSVQSIHRNLVFILSGVNPSVTEIDTINGIQNPLFSIVQSEYLQGLTIEDARNMIRTLGRRMGINMDYEAIGLLYDQYNGHPMLLRMACSYINRQYDSQRRPVEINKSIINKLQDEIDIELAYYFRHVVSEIQQFYPDEYEMFEILASGQTSDFVELSAATEFTKHLYSYGLIAKNENGIPFVKMPVAGRYVALELAKKESRTSLYRLVEPEKRDAWVMQRIRSVVRDIRQLEGAISTANRPKLFGENSFPEADAFVSLKAVNNRQEFERFFNTCNRCFVESIENYGRSLGKQQYFWNEIKNTYPALFEVLHKIKIYRHSIDHTKLKVDVQKKYTEYWRSDTEGIEKLEEQYFSVQQHLLDQFLSSVQIEIGKII